MFIHIPTEKEKKSSICNSKFKIQGENVTILKEKHHNWKNTAVMLHKMNCT